MKRQYQKVLTNPKKSNLGKYLTYLAILTSALIIAGLLFEPIYFVLTRLLKGLIPFFIAILIVYFLKQPRKIIANKLLKNWFKNAKNPQKARMTLSLIIVFILFLALIVGIFWLIVPKLISVIENVITNSDAYINKVKNELTTALEKMPFLQNFITENSIDETLDKILNKLNSYQGQIPQVVSTVGGQLLNIFNLTLIGLVFGFLILLNIEKYKSAIYDYYTTFKTPTQVRKRVEYVQKVDRIFIDYGFSKLIEGIIILLTVTIGLIISKSSMPFELALFMAFLNVIPYIGPIIAVVPILFVNLVLTTMNIALISAVVAIGIVIFVTTFITPLIVGKKIKIDIFTVLLSLTIGGALFGAVGMIIAPPITAVILYTIKNAINNKKIKNNSTT